MEKDFYDYYRGENEKNNFPFLSLEKKNKYFPFLFLLIFLFSLTFISSVPPFQVQDDLVSIDYTKQDVYKTNEDIHFNFFVFNTTSGLKLDDTSASCVMNIFEKQGNHLLNRTSLKYDSINKDFDLHVDKGNFTISGNYAGEVACNTSVNGGGLSFPFEVTPSGFTGSAVFYFIILILSFGIIILGFSKNDAPIVILGSFGLYFVGLYILFFGIDGIKDAVYTWAIGIIVLMLASYISLKSSSELIEG